MHRPHMSGREPQRTADPGRGGVPVAHYIRTYIGVSLLAALGHWKPVRDLGEKGLQGLQASTWSRNQEIARYPGPPMPHTGNCAPASQSTWVPPAATTRDPLPLPLPWMRHCPVRTLAQCHPLAYLLAADPSPGPLSAPAALASAFSSVYVPALRRCVSRVRVNPSRGASAVDVRRLVRPELRRGNGAGASENRAHAPRGGPLPPPSAP